MKTRSILVVALSIGASVLSACSSYPSQSPSAMSGMSKSDGDMKEMCDMHKKMMGSMSPDDQKKMMEEHMKDMSPEMRAQHMGKMKQCM